MPATHIDVSDSASLGAQPFPGGKGISVHAENGVMYMFLDPKVNFGMSSTGKTTVIGSSCGNRPLGKSNAMMGFNAYCKDFAAVKVDCETTEGKGTVWTAFGQNCEWMVTKENKICIAVDFSNAANETKESSSGKTVLLASSRGNARLGSTGIALGLNAYRTLTTKFELSELSFDPPMHDAISPTINAEKDTLTVKIDASKLPVPKLSIPFTILKQDPLLSFSFSFKLANAVNESSNPLVAPEEGLSSIGSKRIRNAEITVDRIGTTVNVTSSLLPPHGSKFFPLSASGKSFIVAKVGGIQCGSLTLTMHLIKKVMPLPKDEVKEMVLSFLGSLTREEMQTTRVKDIKKHVAIKVGLFDIEGDEEGDDPAGKKDGDDTANNARSELLIETFLDPLGSDIRAWTTDFMRAAAAAAKDDETKTAKREREE